MAMENKLDQESKVPALMDQLNILTIKSFPESNPLPVMRVLDDGSVLYSNTAAEKMFAQYCIGKIWDVPQAWMSYLEQALKSGQSSMPLREGEKTYDLMMISVDTLCVNIYVYDVTEREQALQNLQQLSREQEQVVILRTAELSEANQQLSEKNRRYKTLLGKLEMIAMQDELTGLPNRRCFSQAAGQAMSRSRRSHGLLAILFLDLNGFKQINDKHGHDVGDLLLCEVARRLNHCLRDLDMPARLGGDEFAVLVEGFSQTYDVHLPAQRITYALSRPYKLAGKEMMVSASMGISIFPDTSDSLDELLKQSDQAMYQAKAVGGGYQFFKNKSNCQQVNGKGYTHDEQ